MWKTAGQACQKSILLLLAIVLVWTSAPMLPSAKAETDIYPNMQNGGFEQAEDGLPVHWTKFSGTVESSDVQVLEGSRSVYLVDDSSSGTAGLRSAPIAVNAGSFYDGSIYTYIMQGTSQLYLEFWNEAGTRIAVQIADSKTVGRWSRISAAGIAPEDAVYATLLIYLHKGNVGSAYFDQAELTTFLPELSNPGFEKQGDEGIPEGWFIFSPEAESLTEQVKSGDWSVKLTDASPDKNTGLRSEFIAVDAGVPYEASVQVYNVMGSSELYLEFWDAANTRIHVERKSSSVNGRWDEIQVMAQAPSEAVSATILLYQNIGNIGTAYFDDVSFVKGPEEEMREFPLVVDGYPRLFFTAADLPALRAKTEDNSQNPFGITGGQIWEQVKMAADQYLTETDFSVTYYNDHVVTYPLPPVQPQPMDVPPGYGDSSYPYWTMMGRGIQDRLETLSMAYVISENEAYSDRAIEYAMALTDWDSWDEENYDCGGETCLGTAHLVQGIAVVYDMLYDQLNEQQRQAIETALITKGLEPLYADVYSKIDHNIQMLRATALGTGGALLLGKSDQAHKYLTRATEYYKWYLDARMQSGQQEGFLYTSYAMENMMIAIDHISRTTGVREWIEHPFIDDFLVQWVIYASAPGVTGGLANISDAGNANYFYITMSVINSALNNGHAGWYLANAKPSASPLQRLIYFDPDAMVTEPDLLPESKVFDEIGWAALRSGWEQADSLLVLVSNQSRLGHNHFDQNSFLIAANNTWIAADPGYQDFSPGPKNEFTYNFGHNTIHVDGQGQSYKGGGRLTEGLLSPAYDYVKGSAADAYFNPKLTKFDRHIAAVKPNYYVLFDDIAADEAHTYDWMLFTGRGASYEVDGGNLQVGESSAGNDLYITKGSAQMAAKFLADGPMQIHAETYSGAEEYGSYIRVSSGEPSESYRYLTVIEVDPIKHNGIYRAPELMSQAESSGQEMRVIAAADTQLVFFRGAEEGNYVTFKVNVEEEGIYEAHALMIQSPLYGKYQLYVDGTPAGGIYDGYNETVQKAAPHPLGQLHLAEGVHEFKVELVGQNELSGNKFIGIEGFQLLDPNDDGGGELIKTEIDAVLVQGSGGIGAEVQRNDENGISDLVLFREDSASQLNIAGAVSDGEQVVVSKGEEKVTGYSMTRGTALFYQEQTLISAAEEASISMNKTDSRFEGIVELAEVSQVELYAGYVVEVHVNGTVLSDGQYQFDHASGIVTLNLEKGRHEISLKIDEEPPQIEVLVNGEPLADSDVFEDSELLDIGVTATDVSGIEKIKLSVNETVYALGSTVSLAGQPGIHSIEVVVTDLAGWQAAETFLVEVTTSLSSMMTLIERYSQNDELVMPMVQKLTVHLNQVEHQLSKGNVKQAVTQMEHFLDQLNLPPMQQHISPSAKSALQNDAEYLIEQWNRSDN